ncbi:dynamin family protein [Derxia gummosa]|uniref:Dynamin family protein n=1 Tax=Derxia gummosa DSM 723 TaxID=1121388 RepID=A0A8B6X9U6_9BURK|nr:dynamin family protein [Derxia gummosa]
MSQFARQVEDYSSWRSTLAQAIARHRDWLSGEGLESPAVSAALGRMLDRLRGEKLSVAFVAEFSRGKSELINAVFFASYGRRMLPSAAGRTTMCPTELVYDPSLPACIRLLPIETRASAATTSDYRQRPDAWTSFNFRTDDADAVAAALARVAETREAPVAEARELGLAADDEPASTVEIPVWRHAIINFPHPLLEQGLVVIDTPGLNALGSEPELTLNLLPGADAVVFILAADTGVTLSEHEVWSEHLGGMASSHRVVVLNKIDAMWDALRTPAEIEAEIARQVDESARTLGLERDQVFALSAQKALLAKIDHDDELLARSGVGAFETALSERLVEQRQRIVRTQLALDLAAVDREARSLLVGRQRIVAEQLEELESLRGKNTVAVDRMLERLQNERSDFDQLVKQLVALRAVFTRLSNQVWAVLGEEAVNEAAREARDKMIQHRFSAPLRGSMHEYFDTLGERMRIAQSTLDEIQSLVNAMGKRFAVERSMTIPPAPQLKLGRYVEAIDRLRRKADAHFGALNIVTRLRANLVERFFAAMAQGVRDIFDRAGRDAEAWLDCALTPIESQVREYQRDLRRRLESIRRVHEASHELDDRVDELRGQLTFATQLTTDHDARSQELRIQIATEVQPLTATDVPRMRISGSASAMVAGAAAPVPGTAG